MRTASRLFGLLRATAPVARAIIALGVTCVVGCEKTKEPSAAPSSTTENAGRTAVSAASSAPTAPTAVASSTALSLATSKPAPERVVAIGDLHGDLESARRALRLAGAIDPADRWIGGKLVVVQTGDLIDRGDDDRKILDLFERLKGDAKRDGGEVVALVGNHEIMNGELDFRYVTPGAFQEFANVSPKDEGVARVAAQLDPGKRGRASAFLPRGPYARILADRPVVARVGDTIFVHGGVIPRYARGSSLDEINAGARAWLLGEVSQIPKALTAEDGPLWSRMYSAAPGREECVILEQTLAILHAKRMVMGHTVQKPHISPACDAKAWRIDVGMSSFYGGPIEALELRGETVTVLEEPRR